MEKVTPVVVIREITENDYREYKIEKIVTIDRFFQISSYWVSSDTFETLKEVGEYVFNKIQGGGQFTMCHISAEDIKYDILIVDISNPDNTYLYAPECRK